MAKNGTIAYVTELPPCDVCKAEGRIENGEIPRAAYDLNLGAIHNRPLPAVSSLYFKKPGAPWAFLCETCTESIWFDEPPKLGIGFGQQLVVRK